MSQLRVRQVGAVRLDLPLRIALSYAAVGAVWIVSSDFLLSRWRGRFSSVETLGSVKGLVFVLVTAILLYGVIRRLVGQQVVTAEKLKESQLRWQFALEGAGDGLWDRDVPAGQVFYSRQWKNILGYADNEISNTPGEWEALLHPDDRERAVEEFQRFLQGAIPVYRSEFRMRAKDGSYRWILDRGGIVNRLPDGRPWRVVGTHTDITAIKSAQSRLADSLAFARAVLHFSPIGIITYGPDGSAVTANRAAARMIGTDVPGLLRQNFRELESWRRDGLLAAAEEALKSEHEVMHDGYVKSSFGNSLWLESRMVPFRIDGEQHLLFMMKDTTGERRALEGLQLLNAAVQAAPGGWVITDAEGVIEFVNPGFTALTGYASEEVVGRKPSILKSGRHNAHFYSVMWETIKRGDVWQGELENRRKSGDLYQEQMTIAPVRDIEGRIAHFVAIKQNVSEQKRLEGHEFKMDGVVDLIEDDEVIFAGSDPFFCHQPERVERLRGAGRANRGFPVFRKTPCPLGLFPRRSLFSLPLPIRR